jgi:hypothetical protein
MDVKKATVVGSLLMVCFVLAAQSAKATDVNIIFRDLGDSVVVEEPSGSVACGTSSVEQCTISLLQPSPGATVQSTTITALPYFLAEPNTTGILCLNGVLGPCISDGFTSNAVAAATTHASAVTLVFQSDAPLAEAVNLPACISTPTHVCQNTENGTPQEVGTITWSDGTVDHIQLQSDVEPEPASLILFGSGLAMAGGFIRRRRRAVTPFAS